ncbi:peptidyl-prolyl cis-trans isomerase FKBP43 [Capsella rubella]|nr:peptidyl-prolyl cis-trans isomerase FKBP43 [Capsella rubella]
MAFWGVEVKPSKTFTLKANEATGIRRLHLSQATLGHGNGTNRSILQCIVGNKSPLFLCVLTPDKVDSCQLNLEFEEADEVIFSVIGPRSVHITGYFLGRSTSFRSNDDESESYGEDIVDTDMEKGSSDDYDYSDSFINDDDPPGRGSHMSSTDDDEISIKEMAAKTKDKKDNGKHGRLRKKFQVSDSDSDETSARADDSSNEDSIGNEHKISKVLSSESPLPSRVTRSKAKSSTLVNGEPNAKCKKTSEERTHTNKNLDERVDDKPLSDVKFSPVQKGCDILSKKKRKKERSKSSAIINLDDGEGENIPESLQNEKPDTEKGIKSSSNVSPSPNGDATLSKKKRKRDRREETTDVQENPFECLGKKKQAIDKNIEKEAGIKEPLEMGTSSNGVIIEEIEKGKLDGKSAVKGKKVSILYTGTLKDTGKVFDSNLGEAPLRFRLGGEKVIEGLSIGVEGMRFGDKRRLIIPPSLGYGKDSHSEEGFKEQVPKNAWLVYEVEAVKIR